MTFANIFRTKRRQKGWTAQELIKILDRQLSPAYITKIEAHGEIPSPEVIIRIAQVFEMDEQILLTIAQREKVAKYQSDLQKRYRDASQHPERTK